MFFLSKAALCETGLSRAGVVLMIRILHDPIIYRLYYHNSRELGKIEKYKQVMQYFYHQQYELCPAAWVQHGPQRSAPRLKDASGVTFPKRPGTTMVIT